MSNNDQSRNIPYDPLPLTNDDTSTNALYNAPPSPEPRLSAFHTPQLAPTDLGPDDHVFAAGAAQPRFLGAALYDGPGTPGLRDSFASSNHTFQSSEYNSSIYALNAQGSGRFDGSYRDDPQENFYGEHGVPMSPVTSSGRVLEKKRATYAPPKAKSRRIIILVAVVILIVIAIAVFIPIYFVISKRSSRATDGSQPSSESEAGPSATSTVPKQKVAVTGGDGSLITMEDGTTFTYRNPFGGFWYWDENDPFNNGAKAQSWTPALNETFNYGIDKIRGSVSIT